jgi:hypothetical protein
MKSGIIPEKMLQAKFCAGQSLERINKNHLVVARYWVANWQPLTSQRW